MREQTGGENPKDEDQMKGWTAYYCYFQQPKGRAGQAPEGDISLQLCRNLLLFTVLCATAGLHSTLISMALVQINGLGS